MTETKEFMTARQGSGENTDFQIDSIISSASWPKPRK